MYFRCAGDYDAITVANKGGCLCQGELKKSSGEIWFGYFNRCGETEDSCDAPKKRFYHINRHTNQGC